MSGDKARSRRAKAERLINVLMRDGSACRIPISRAERFLESGEAQRFISQTIYKAIKAGVVLKSYDCVDDVKLKAEILALTEKSEKS